MLVGHVGSMILQCVVVAAILWCVIATVVLLRCVVLSGAVVDLLEFGDVGDACGSLGVWSCVAI